MHRRAQREIFFLAFAFGAQRCTSSARFAQLLLPLCSQVVLFCILYVTTAAPMYDLVLLCFGSLQRGVATVRRV